MSALPETTSPVVCCKNEQNIYVFKDSVVMVYDAPTNKWRTLELALNFVRISSAHHDGKYIWITGNLNIHSMRGLTMCFSSLAS